MNETAASIGKFLVENKTTQPEVEAKFGPPAGISTDDRQTVWVYTYHPAAGSGKFLSVKFNPQRVVIDYLFAE